MADRIQCCVPYCRRTHHNREGFIEWVCQTHWRAVRKRTKRFWRLAKAKARNAATEKEWSKEHLRCQRAWERCKREAVEAAMGIR